MNYALFVASQDEHVSPNSSHARTLDGNNLTSRIERRAGTFLNLVVMTQRRNAPGSFLRAFAGAVSCAAFALKPIQGSGNAIIILPQHQPVFV